MQVQLISSPSTTEMFTDDFFNGMRVRVTRKRKIDVSWKTEFELLEKDFKGFLSSECGKETINRIWVENIL